MHTCMIILVPSLLWLSLSFRTTQAQHNRDNRSSSDLFSTQLSSWAPSGQDLTKAEVDSGIRLSPAASRYMLSHNSSQESEHTTTYDMNSCNFETIAFDPHIHKCNYTIVVHAISGLKDALTETSVLFGEYLTKTAGKKFNPPIELRVVAYYYGDLFEAMSNEDMDFLYSNSGTYSCIATEVGATALGTVVKSYDLRGQHYDLDSYSGVIAVRDDNNALNNIADLEDKTIAAGDITNFMGGQMQIYEMLKAGMSYVNDPKKFVFTGDQQSVLQGVLAGTFDVGFVRTEQIELCKDVDGNPVDPKLFKIIEPKVSIMESGELFPFLHSTDVVPEWPLAALPSVPEDVQLAVQDAIMDYGAYVLLGQLQECEAGLMDVERCSDLKLESMTRTLCNANDDIVATALQASNDSRVSRFHPPSSYFTVRSKLQEAGFMYLEGTAWKCLRPDNLYDGITCPTGYFKRDETEFKNGCDQIGLGCDDNVGWSCFCKPCVKAFEVDIYHLAEEEEDTHLIEYYGAALKGCAKMEICGVTEQRKGIRMRIFDNMLRDGANVTVTVNAGNTRKTILPKQVPNTFAYDFTISDTEARVQVLEISVNGQPISQSPVRVMVVDADCDAKYGEGSNRLPDMEGNCICAGNTYEMLGSCVESAAFFVIIFSAAIVIISIMLSIYLGYKKKQSDSIWNVNVEELQFNEPPEIIGAGGFGVVILGVYRGTQVAVKRVLPPKKSPRISKQSTTLGQSSDFIEYETTNPTIEKSASRDMRKKVNKSPHDDKKTHVKFGSAIKSDDIESQQSIAKSSSMQMKGSVSGSNKDWEKLMMLHHSNNDIMKLLDSATSSDHGSGSMFEGSVSKHSVFLRFLPMWIRFDEHSRRVNEFVNEMRMLSRLRHPCITTVMGAVVSNTVDPMLVMEYMEYGSLHDLLHNETMTPGGEIILQVVRDIVQGIQFLHASKPPILHGDLKAKNILVDSRFRAKVADFGFSHFKCAKQRNILQGTPFYMAPEYLRRRTEYTTACDIYSLAMIIYEIYARESPFEGEDPRKVLPKVCHPRLNKRPTIPESCPPKMVDLMKKCWSANAFFRPSAKDIDYFLVEMNFNDTEPLETTKERVRDNLKRKPTSLYDVFPKHIADALNAGKKVEAESHDIVTVVFSDIVGFTTISEECAPLKVANMLDRLYQAFDKLAEIHHVFKVETIGDAYMGVTNLDGSEYDTHVKQVAEYAQDAIRAASEILIDEDDASKGYVQIRIGFHSGPVVSNVIGSLNPRYGLFGDTVNTASRMESNSVPGKIHCSFASAQLLQSQAPDIPLTVRGMIKIKGKGKMRTYWVGEGEEDLVDTPETTAEVPETILGPCFTNEVADVIHHSFTCKTTTKEVIDDSDHNSQGSHVTQKTLVYLESLSDSGRDPPTTGSTVPTSQESRSTKIQMDGTIQKVVEFFHSTEEIC